MHVWWLFVPRGAERDADGGPVQARELQHAPSRRAHAHPRAASEAPPSRFFGDRHRASAAQRPIARGPEGAAGRVLFRAFIEPGAEMSNTDTQTPSYSGPNRELAHLV